MGSNEHLPARGVGHFPCMGPKVNTPGWAFPHHPVVMEHPGEFPQARPLTVPGFSAYGGGEWDPEIEAITLWDYAVEAFADPNETRTYRIVGFQWVANETPPWVNVSGYERDTYRFIHIPNTVMYFRLLAAARTTLATSVTEWNYYFTPAPAMGDVPGATWDAVPSVEDAWEPDNNFSISFAVQPWWNMTYPGDAVNAMSIGHTGIARAPVVFFEPAYYRFILGFRGLFIHAGYGTNVFADVGYIGRKRVQALGYPILGANYK